MAIELDPWGNALVDYNRLFAEFGLQHVDDKLLSRLKTKHRLWRRGVVLAHRDFDLVLNARDKKQPIAAMTGIKPSSEFHLGSKLTAEELVFLQQELGAKVFYCVADLEAHADNGLTLEESAPTAVSNVADLLALGLDEKHAFIYKQSEEKRVMNFAYLAARRTTNATLQALYGDRNIGLYFSVLTQVGDIMLPQHPDFGIPNVVVPVGVDQDPHLRLARDLAAKMGYKTPASTYHRFVKALNGESKMSKRDPANVLSLNDELPVAKKKLMSVFTGGRATVEEQKKLGGQPDICVNFENALVHFEEDDKSLAERKRKCLAGEILCGQCKQEVCAYAMKWMEEHQKKKKASMKKAEKLLEKE